MYFLEQITAQLSQCLMNHEGQLNDGPVGGVQDPEPEEIPMIEGTEGGNNIAEMSVLNEFNEEIDAIKNDSELLIKYTNILGSFLERVKNGEIEGLSTEDSDFQRLLEMYASKFEYLKTLSDRGHQIQGEVHFYAHNLNEKVDEAIESGSINIIVDADLSPEELSEKETEILEQEARREELINEIIPKIEGIDLEEASREVKDIINYIGEVREGYPDTIMSVVDRLAYLEHVNTKIEETSIEVEKILMDAVIVGEDGETFGEERNSLIGEKIKELQENGTERQKEILADRGILDITGSDLLALSRAGIDLAHLLLIDKAGKAISNNLTVGDEYIFNAGGNNDLGDTAHRVFDVYDVQSVEMGGNVYSRSPNPLGFVSEEGKLLYLRDGMSVKISSIESISEDTREQYRAVADTVFDTQRPMDLLERGIQEKGEKSWIKLILGALLHFGGEDSEMWKQQLLAFGWISEDEDGNLTEGTMPQVPGESFRIDSPELGGALQEGAEALGCDIASLKAVVQVESGGQMRATRFEPHIYTRAQNGDYGPGDRRMISTSWGMFQFMGFNYKKCGFSSVEAMVDVMQRGTVGDQVQALVRFISSSPTMHQALINQDWHAFAYRYNGRNYRQNRYAEKMENFHRQFS